MNHEPTVVSITPGTILTVFGVGLLVLLFFYLQNLVLIVLTAIVFASAVEPAVSWFMRYRFPRALAVATVYLSVIGSLFFVVYLFLPPLLEETQKFASALPQLVETLNLESLRTSLGTNPLIQNATDAVSNASLSETIGQFQDAVSTTGQGAFRALAGVFGGLVSFVLIVVLSFYFAVQETGVDDFLRVVTPVKHQKYVIDLWKRSHHKIGLWMQGQLVLSLIMGVLSYLWLTILGVPYALIISLVVAILELVPFFGPIMSGVIATAVAFSSGGIETGLLVAGGFVILHQLESNLIYPLVVRNIVGVPPLLVILALIAGGQLFGFLGILLSVPIAAALQVFVTDIQREKERQLAAMR